MRRAGRAEIATRCAIPGAMQVVCRPVEWLAMASLRANGPKHVPYVQSTAILGAASKS